MAEPQRGPVAPAEAIAAFRRRGLNPFPSYSWLDVDAQMHRAGFTVAKSIQYDVTGVIYAELLRVLAEGRTFADFKRELVPLLKAKGWWGRAPMTDPATGATEVVQLGSERRLRIIFDTNLRMSYAEGRWEQIQRVKGSRPYLRYVAVLDSRTRPEHRAWHGTILPVDHPWWRTHFPPNGWRCRCTVQQVSKRDLQRNGWTVSDPPPDDPRPWRNRRTGEERQIPAGIDPGFDHNPGALAMDAPGMAAALAKIEAMRAAGAPAVVVDAGRSALNTGPRLEAPRIPRGPQLPGPPAGGSGTGELTPLDRDAQTTLRAKLTIDAAEWLRAYDQPTGALIAEHSSGAAASVGIPPAVVQALRDPTRQIALHHSHPQDSALSQADLDRFVGGPGMTVLGAHGPRVSYVVRRLPGVLYDPDDWVNRSEIIDLGLAIDLDRHVATGLLTESEANQLMPWLRLRVLARDGYLDLAIEGDDLETAIFQRLGRRGSLLLSRAIAGLRSEGL